MPGGCPRCEIIYRQGIPGDRGMYPLYSWEGTMEIRAVGMTAATRCTLAAQGRSLLIWSPPLTTLRLPL